VSRDLSRRELFGLLRKARPAGPPLASRRWLRPPGAAPEAEFASLCHRCGRCVDICPREALFALPASEVERAGTPAFVARRAPCAMCEGLRCQTVCPSGALAPLAKGAVRMGLAEVVAARCIGFAGEACAVCVTACPVPGAVRSEGGRPVVDAALCTGCGSCEHACPTVPASIVVRPL
jgi:MauM/NapG family ferredoxin protein